MAGVVGDGDVDSGVEEGAVLVAVGGEAGGDYAGSYEGVCGTGGGGCCCRRCHEVAVAGSADVGGGSGECGGCDR